MLRRLFLLSALMVLPAALVVGAKTVQESDSAGCACCGKDCACSSCCCKTGQCDGVPCCASCPGGCCAG